MMACTAKWSSMIFSLTCPPIPTPPPICGTRLESDTWLRPGSARLGGAWYAWPGSAPAELLRKNASHDCNNQIRGCKLMQIYFKKHFKFSPVCLYGRADRLNRVIKYLILFSTPAGAWLVYNCPG